MSCGGWRASARATFVSREVIDACVIAGRHEWPPVAGIAYRAFTHPAGGSGSDSFSLAIAHVEERQGRRIAVLTRSAKRVRPSRLQHRPGSTGLSSTPKTGSTGHGAPEPGPWEDDVGLHLPPTVRTSSFHGEEDVPPWARQALGLHGGAMASRRRLGGSRGQNPPPGARITTPAGSIGPRWIGRLPEQDAGLRSTLT